MNAVVAVATLFLAIAVIFGVLMGVIGYNAESSDERALGRIMSYVLGGVSFGLLCVIIGWWNT